MKAFSEFQHRHRVPTSVLGAVLAADERTLYAAAMDGVYRVDVETGEVEALDAHESYTSSAALVADERLLVTAGYDGAVQWYDLARGERVRWVKAHDFWSWAMRASGDGKLLASVTGQYLAGSYKYEPAAEREPSVVVLSAESGEVVQRLPHVPSVQAVAFSPDSRFVAAGNIMGDIRVWDVASGELAAQWTTEAFTSWGIIKSHCYLGGVFDMTFTPDGTELLLSGHGPMRDPMAGNGRQLWQKFAWQEETPRLVDETHEGESGEGLMETLAVHPDGKRFVMGGRLRGGEWNVALFDLTSGEILDSLKTEGRVTQAMFSADGKRLVLAGTKGQPRPKDGKPQTGFGMVDVVDVAPS